MFIPRFSITCSIMRHSHLYMTRSYRTCHSEERQLLVFLRRFVDCICISSLAPFLRSERRDFVTEVLWLTRLIPQFVYL